MKGQDPETPEEWQEAVDQSYVLKLLDSARRYGLVKCGPEIDVARCEELLERGRRLKVYPSEDAVDRLLSAGP